MTGAQPLSLRQRVYAHVDPAARNIEGLSNFNKFVVLAVLAASFVAIMRTEPAFARAYASEYFWIEVVTGVFFIVEYGLRLWTAPDHYPELGPHAARVKFVTSPLAILDVIIIASIFLPLIFQNSAFLRILRVMRILALARLSRFSMALRHLLAAIHERRYDLLVTLGFAGFLLLFGATALYWLEGETQPEAYGSIPRALWWAVITLTTVGYGDVSPITAEGKLVAGFVALAGIALVALPTGILAAAFSDGMQRRREELAAAAEDE